MTSGSKINKTIAPYENNCKTKYRKLHNTELIEDTNKYNEKVVKDNPVQMQSVEAELVNNKIDKSELVEKVNTNMLIALKRNEEMLKDKHLRPRERIQSIKVAVYTFIELHKHNLEAKKSKDGVMNRKEIEGKLNDVLMSISELTKHSDIGKK